MSDDTSDALGNQLKHVFSPEAIAQLERRVRLLELSVSTLPAEQRRSEAQRLERMKREVRGYRKLATILQWEVIEP